LKKELTKDVDRLSLSPHRKGESVQLKGPLGIGKERAESEEKKEDGQEGAPTRKRKRVRFGKKGLRLTGQADPTGRLKDTTGLSHQLEA